MVECPIKKDAREARILGRDMVRLLRKLRRDARYCRRCELSATCQLPEQFQSQVEEAILEINIEWGLV